MVASVNSNGFFNFFIKALERLHLYIQFSQLASPMQSQNSAVKEKLADAIVTRIFEDILELVFNGVVVATM